MHLQVTFQSCKGPNYGEQIVLLVPFSLLPRTFLRITESSPLAATCLYDNMKVAVTSYDSDQPI